MPAPASPAILSSRLPSDAEILSAGLVAPTSQNDSLGIPAAERVAPSFDAHSLEFRPTTIKGQAAQFNPPCDTLSTANLPNASASESSPDVPVPGNHARSTATPRFFTIRLLFTCAAAGAASAFAVWAYTELQPLQVDRSPIRVPRQAASTAPATAQSQTSNSQAAEVLPPAAAPQAPAPLSTVRVTEEKALASDTPTHGAPAPTRLVPGNGAPAARPPKPVAPQPVHSSAPPAPTPIRPTTPKVTQPQVAPSLPAPQAEAATDDVAPGARFSRTRRAPGELNEAAASSPLIVP